MGEFFLIYGAKLIQNGLSSTEVMSALTSMRVEIGLDKNELSVSPERDPQQRFTWPPMRMEIRSILKSLGVKSTIPRLQTQLLKQIEEMENLVADKGYDLY